MALRHDDVNTVLPPFSRSDWVGVPTDENGVTTFPLACAIDGVHVIARIEVSSDGVAIEPFPGQPPRIEMAIEAWTQTSARVIVAAHTYPKSLPPAA